MKTPLVVGTMAVLCAAVIAADAQPERQTGDTARRGPGEAVLTGMRFMQNPRVVEELGLSESELKHLKDAMFDLQSERAKLRADLEVAGIQQARLLTEDDVNESDLMSAVEKTGAVRTEIAKLEMKALLVLRENLNKEQREKLRKMMGHARAKQQASRMQGHRKGPQGPAHGGEFHRRGGERPFGGKAREGGRRPGAPGGDAAQGNE